MVILDRDSDSPGSYLSNVYGNSAMCGAPACVCPLEFCSKCTFCNCALRSCLGIEAPRGAWKGFSLYSPVSCATQLGGLRLGRQDFGFPPLPPQNVPSRGNGAAKLWVGLKAGLTERKPSCLSLTPSRAACQTASLRRSTEITEEKAGPTAILDVGCKFEARRPTACVFLTHGCKDIY
jgi:hypothetical protein